MDARYLCPPHLLYMVGVWGACVTGFALGTLGYLKARLCAKPFPPLPACREEGLLSIIIPCFNEAERIENALRDSLEQAQCREKLEFIVVDGGSTDGTFETLNALKLPHCNCKVIQSSVSGRGAALMEGAAAASGALLLFLHADTLLPTRFDQIIRQTLALPNTAAGAFTFEVDRRGMAKPPLGLGTMEIFANIRCKLFMMPYGDQGLFMSAAHYKATGGFKEVLMMEDLEFVSRLRSRALGGGGRVVVVDAKAACSPRRWLVNGVLKNTLLNQVFVLAYVWCGVPAETIYRWYYRR
eukprot:CAMPEP_0114554974 /NCGR_PEP_ID=MMETSP0114-20121206/8498_1 /TAXON_ID=31324 /ORGANISM="Goniomonas sp, Strain m" /LENGTH=296 /DNA_ID=CAMNT_0001740061 /DNA_START=80 /DNA_END=970 /DNA_ORIENTATION=+